MGRILFVTGTDTGCGKTFASTALIHALRARGRQVLAMKPVASGCEMTPDGLRNSDALALQSAASTLLPYDRVNPCAFAPPIAPHIAAARAGVRIPLPEIVATARDLATQCDVLVVEGVGGWRVPLTDTEEVADLARQLQAGVILVVGLRLGCINHALLTAQAIGADALPLLGWIANRIDPDMDQPEANLATLTARLDAPCLGCLPHYAETVDPRAAAQYLNPSSL
ncbi:MAG: dethiobiotin synthase [Gammaproteobacteria bacterium]|nr:dethiobiotin synthase [Gammaproteobacteria bacterium]